ncbi:unnamed protein product [Laminaria digitata]
MKPSKGDSMSHPVTELEAPRAVLVQGLPLLDQELTESSIVQVFSAYGEISKLLLQTHEESKSQRAALVFVEEEGANAALQANGRDILGANCSVSLASSKPSLTEGLGRENVSDDPSAEGGLEGGTLTTAEWIKGLFAQGMVYTRLFDEKLGVSEKAKALATKVQELDEKHDVSGKFVAVAMTAHAKAIEVDTKLGVSETATRWAQKTKESTDKALESNPRVAAGVNQAGDAVNKMITGVTGFAQQAMGQPQPEELPGPRPANPDENLRMLDDAAAAPAEGGSDAPPTKNI